MSLPTRGPALLDHLFSRNLYSRFPALVSIVLLSVGLTSLAYGQKQVFITPTQPWVDTGVSVSAGSMLTITATGEMDWDTDNTCPAGQSCTVGPDGQNPGVPCPVGDVLAPVFACYSLIGKIGDGTPFEVGAGFKSPSAPASGELYLSVNDGYFADNTLGWTATITTNSSCLPATIDEQEGPFSGVWSWNGSLYNATWSNGAVATLQVESFSANSVVLNRTDTSASISAGLTAVYTGKISSSGTSIVDGSVTWTWPGVPGYPATGTWTASWTSACSSPSHNTITSKTFATVPGIDNTVRTTLGVGEQVWLYTDPSQPANWSITSTSGLARLAGGTAESVYKDHRFADGKPLGEEAEHHFATERGLPDTECDQDDLAVSQTNADIVCLSTPYVNDQITVVATFGDGSTAFKKFTVTQPTGLILQRLEYPDKTDDSDFNFFKYPRFRRVEFRWSPAVFVTPGNVSFAYAGIVERDPGHEHGDYAPPYNLLFSLGNTTAWLVSCDHVENIKAHFHDQFAFPWKYSPFDKRDETPFSLVQTKWDYVGGEFSASKGQIEALSPGLAPVQTPISSATAAELNVIDRGFPYFSYQEVDRSQCPPQVVNQFTCLSGDYCTKHF